MLNENIKDIEYKKVKSFFENKGWGIIKENFKSKFFSPEDKEGNKLSFSVPNEINFLDYNEKIYLLFQIYADYRNASLESILEEFNQFIKKADPSFTSIIFRTENKFGNDIELGAFDSIYSGLKKSMTYSLSNELRNNPFIWERNPSKKALKLIKKFRFDQTQKGSFICKIKTPILEETEQTKILEDTIFTAQDKAICRIAKGLEWIIRNNFSQDNKDDYQRVNQSSTFGLNANMAFNLAEILDHKFIEEVELYFEINNTLKTMEDIKIGKVILDKNISNKLKTFGNILTMPIEKRLKFKAKVIGSYSKNPTDEGIIKSVNIEIVDFGNIPLNLSGNTFKLELETKDYENAVKGHLKSKIIELDGIFSIEKGKIIKAKDLKIK